LSQLPAYDERELCIRIADGDEQAFAEVYYKYVALLFPYLSSLTKSESAAEEIIQNSMLRIWLNRDKLVEIENLRGWIFRIASNEAKNHFKKVATFNRVKDNYEDELMRPSVSTDTENTAFEIKRIVGNAIDRLSPQRKKIYKLNREDGMKVSEIAEALGLSPETVKKHLYTALEQIREELKQNGYTLSVFLLLLLF